MVAVVRVAACRWDPHRPAAVAAAASGLYAISSVVSLVEHRDPSQQRRRRGRRRRVGAKASRVVPAAPVASATVARHRAPTEDTEVTAVTAAEPEAEPGGHSVAVFVCPGTTISGSFTATGGARWRGRPGRLFSQGIRAQMPRLESCSTPRPSPGAVPAVRR